jgi:hypothetical protein
LEEIHGFSSLIEFNDFVKYINNLIDGGLVEEIAVNPNYGAGLIYGGRWFRCKECKEIWRLINPDPPFRGLWERVIQV